MNLRSRSEIRRRLGNGQLQFMIVGLLLGLLSFASLTGGFSCAANTIVAHRIIASVRNSAFTALRDSPLGDLDDVLTKARKRKGVNFQYKVQAFLDAPVVQLKRPYPGLKSSLVYTRSDVALVLVALKINAPGFALGLVLGKLTAAPVREITTPPAPVQILLLPLWPVIWAIGIDQFF